MTVAAVILALVVLTGAVWLLATAGARRHPEDLNSHDTEPVRPMADRPADAGAEPMGVAEAGEPSIEPTAEDS